MAAPASMASLPSGSRSGWKNLGQRAISAVVLIGVVLVAVFYEPLFFIMISVAVVLLAREWAHMSAPPAPIRLAIAVAIAVLVPVICANLARLSARGVGPALSSLSRWPGR